jgi:type I restriction enzyme R subunit
VKGDDDGQAFFGLLDGRLSSEDGEAIDQNVAAQVALDIIAIVKAHHIVGVWSNDVAQNNMRNAIDDYFFDVLRDEKGIGVPVEMLDDLEQKILDLARARFP